MSLPLTELGRTGLTVSRIGLGLAALGRPAYINIGHHDDLGSDLSVDAMRARTHQVLDAACDAGVRYFDAARSYGLAEDFLGSWLERRGIERGEVTVGSKWGYTYTGGWRLDADEHEVKDLGAATLRRQLPETRALLGDWLAVYQIHSATIESGVLEDEAVLDQLRRLQAEGVAVGFTATGPDQAATTERALQVGLFDTVQATWNLLERSAGDALAHAHEAGLGVIVKEAVANGRLAGRERLAALDAATRERGCGPDALAIAAVLARPWAHVVLSGAASVGMLTSNLRALELSWDDELEERLGGLAEEPERYWSRRSALDWN